MSDIDNNYINMSSLPKSALPYILDFTPKMRIDYIKQSYDIEYHCSLAHIDHIIPFTICLGVTKSQRKHQEICDRIDNFIECIQNNVHVTIPLTYYTSSQGHVDKYSLIFNPETNNEHKAGFIIDDVLIPLSLTNSIISTLQYIKKYNLICKCDSEYLQNIYKIYLEYYPDAKMMDYEETQKNEANETIKSNLAKYVTYEVFYCIFHYEYLDKIDEQEYRELCATGQFSNNVPILMYNKSYVPQLDEFKNKHENCEKLIYAINLKHTFVNCMYDSDEIGLEYIPLKN